jgi:hypothetical protein
MRGRAEQQFVGTANGIDTPNCGRSASRRKKMRTAVMPLIRTIPPSEPRRLRPRTRSCFIPDSTVMRLKKWTQHCGCLLHALQSATNISLVSDVAKMSLRYALPLQGECGLIAGQRHSSEDATRFYLPRHQSKVVGGVIPTTSLYHTLARAEAESRELRAEAQSR